MIEGRQTLGSIERAIRQVEEEEKALRSQLNARKQELGQMMTARVALFRALAEYRAKSALADGVINEADRLSFQVANILKARLESIAELQQRHDKLLARQSALLAENDARLKAIEALETRLDQIAQEARAALAGTPDYQAQKAQLEAARAVYDKAAEKTSQARTDRIAKGKPYEDDPLFIYLWKRRFGSKDYDANNLIRYLDGRVAALIGYHDARANYAVLLEIPVRLEEHLKKLAAKLAHEREALEAMLAAKIKALAGRDLPQELAAARATLESSNKALEDLRTRLAETDNQLALYAQGHDRSFATAVELSAQFLQREALEKLRAEARRSEAPTDDEVVAEIRSIDQDIATARRKDEAERKKLTSLLDRKQELIKIASDFRRNRYNEPGSIFVPGDDLEGLLVDVLDGVIRGADYWGRARRSQRWRSRPADPYRRSSGGNQNWGASWGGSGADSDADFKTGGGF